MKKIIENILAKLKLKTQKKKKQKTGNRTAI